MHLSLLSGQIKNLLAIIVWKALSHWPEMKIQGDVLHGILPKNTVPTRATHCAFIALQKFYSDHCLIVRFRFFSKKTNPYNLQQLSQHCGSIVQRTNRKVAFCFGAIARKGECTVISRLLVRSVDIVAWPLQRRFAFCTSWKVSEVIHGNDRGEIISNLGSPRMSFPQTQIQCCGFKFLRRSADGSIWCVFRVKTPFSNFSGVVWTENIWCIFGVKPPFSISSGVGWTYPEWMNESFEGHIISLLYFALPLLLSLHLFC